MMKCPQCGEPHTLDECPRWRVPVGYRLLPEKLTPALADAIVECGHFMPNTLWDAVIARHDLIAAPAAIQPAGEMPKSNDGKEQDAFETWANGERYDMATHPMHWLFLNEKTYAARQGWKAALEYVNKAIAAPVSAPVPEACQHSFQKWEGPEGETACEKCKAIAPVPEAGVRERLNQLSDWLANTGALPQGSSWVGELEAIVAGRGEPVPEAKAEQVGDAVLVAHEFLKWNRSLDKPVVEIGKELYVARKVLELAGAAPAVKHEASELPPLPNHPEPHMVWTNAERQAITAYVLADRAARQSTPIAVPSIAHWHDGSAPVDWTPEKVAELHAVLDEYPPEPRKAAVQGSIGDEREIFDAAMREHGFGKAHASYEHCWEMWQAARSPVAAPDSARDAALEEAADTCDEVMRSLESDPAQEMGAYQCVKAIRVLKSATAASSGEKGAAS